MGTVHAKGIEGAAHTFLQPVEEVQIIELDSVSAKVHRVHVKGLKRTKNDIVAKQVQGVFKATNFQEMVIRARDAKLHMEQMGLFKDVSITVDTAKGEDIGKDGYDLTFNVEEHGLVKGGVSTLMGTNDGSVMFNMQLPNVFGRAESIKGEYKYGTKHSTGLSVLFSKPLQGNPNLFFQSSAYQNSGDCPWSGFSEINTGGGARIAFPSKLGNHQVSWEAVWREIGCLTNNVPFAVREECGHSLKSGIVHSFDKDTRDSRVLPSSGMLLRSTQELAGVGGDVNFLKQDLQLQFNKNLFSDVVFQLSLAGGLVRTIKPETNLKLPDKFFVGGPLTLRGFNINGCGPHSERCALGADTYWITGAHLYLPLPFLRRGRRDDGRKSISDYFKTHLFVNAGNLTNINLQNNWKDNLKALGESYRLTYGAGLVMMLGGLARVELNYCIPVKAGENDSINPGFQFGIGVAFL